MSDSFYAVILFGTRLPRIYWKRTGYPYSAGVAWTQGRFDDDDLHSCPEQTGARRSQPIGLPSADQEPMAHAELDGKFSS